MQLGWGTYLQAWLRQVVPRDGCPLPDVTSVAVDSQSTLGPVR